VGHAAGGAPAERARLGDGCRRLPALGSELLVSQTFPIALDSWGPGPVFLGYAGIGVLAFLFVKALVPETKGRSLEDIEADLHKKTDVAEERQPVGAAH
jgi:hypothetical protein